MHQLRNEIGHIDGLRFVIDEMDFCSSIGRRMLLNSPFLTHIDQINQALNQVEQWWHYWRDSNMREVMTKLTIELSYLKDVHGSITSLTASGQGLTDIDLFEIKGLALVNERIRQLIEVNHFNLPALPILTPVLQVLDPDGHRLPSFFISDSFDEELARLRQKFKAGATDEEKESLMVLCNEREDEVRMNLATQLFAYKELLMEALHTLATYDMDLAKARLADKYSWVKPLLKEEGSTVLLDMVNPQVAQLLSARKEIYQPVSIVIADEPTLITGANMSGKSVLLKTIVLIQVLTQYGFFVPAVEASVVPVEDIVLSIGDAQNIVLGLSSFGAEMVCLNALVQAARDGKKVLALIDEPARTTNPTEGLAIVNGLISLLAQYKVRSVISTHYSGIIRKGSSWRVRGFVEERVKYPLEINSLNKCIDYTLEKDDGGAVPHEAIRIAEIMGVDSAFIDECKIFLNKE